MPPSLDTASFVAVSNATAKICALDSQGKQTYPWQESGQQAQGSVNWLRNGKAFLTTQGGNVAIHVLENLKDKSPVILSLPAGPLLARVSGDGKCLVVVQSGVAGAVHVYDIQAILGAGSAAANPPVTLQDHDKPILALAASPGTTHVASSNAAGSVYLHVAGAGVRRTLSSLPCGNTVLMTPKRCLAFSQLANPLRLAAGADDGQVLVWQVPTALQGGSAVIPSPVVVPVKMKGRVMGVGFAAFNRISSAVLLSCSETGQLSAVDMRPFPSLQAGIVVELNVSVSCMSVRDDGQMVAVGTKDGRVGLLRTEDLINHKQNITKMGLIKVFDLATLLDVVDIAFQRVSSRESRELRDSSNRQSGGSAQNATSPPAAAAEPAAAPPTTLADKAAHCAQEAKQHSGSSAATAPVTAAAASGGSVAPGAAPEAVAEASSSHAVPAGRQLAGAGGSGGAQSLLDSHDAKTAARTTSATAAGTVPVPGTAAASAAGQRHHPIPTPATAAASGSVAAGGAVANASRPHSTSQPSTAATAGPSGQPPSSAASAATPAATTSGTVQPQPPSSQQPHAIPAVRPVSVTPLTVPESSSQAPGAAQRRPSEAGGGGGGTVSSSSSGVIAASGSVSLEEAAVASPAARAMAAAGFSPVASPSRLHSPRASLGGGQAGGPSGFPASRLPLVGTAGGDATLAAGLRAYMDDFRQEVRDMVHGLQADTVRQAVGLEMQMAEYVAVLQQDNRQLREEVQQLRQLLETSLRFGLLGQQRGPW